MVSYRVLFEDSSDKVKVFDLGCAASEKRNLVSSTRGNTVPRSPRFRTPSFPQSHRGRGFRERFSLLARPCGIWGEELDRPEPSWTGPTVEEGEGQREKQRGRRGGREERGPL